MSHLVDVIENVFFSAIVISIGLACFGAAWLFCKSDGRVKSTIG